MTLTIARRYRGPSGSGNGGYVAGRLARGLAGVRGAGAVTVTLRRPPPLDQALDIVRAGAGVRLVDRGQLVAEAVVTDDDVTAIPAVEPDVARAAALEFPGLRSHPFPECFVCGTSRDEGDGMRLAPGRLGDDTTACLWTVRAEWADDPTFVWAALDCPGGWAAPIEGRPMLLGRFTGQVGGAGKSGEQCVVMGRLLGGEGRKVWTATTVYGADGQELGRAHATWITLA